MKLEEMKELLSEAKERKLQITVVFTDDKSAWTKAAGVLVDESVHGTIELDPRTIEADLCMAALNQGWPHEMHEAAFYATEKLDTENFLNRIGSSIALMQVRECGLVFRAPLGAFTVIRSC